MIRRVRRMHVRFGLRTLLLCVPLIAALCAWIATRPLVEVDAWIIVNQIDLSQGSAGARDLRIGPIEPHEAALRDTSLLARALAPRDVALLPIVHRQDDPAVWLRDHLQVEFHPQARLVRISLQGRNPDQLEKLLESIAVAYSMTLQAAPGAPGIPSL